MPKWVKRLGQRNSLIIVTVISVLISITIASTVRFLVDGEITRTVLLVSTLVPLFISPVLGFFFFRAYFELDEVKTRLAYLSVTDDLTQLYNRRYFMGRAHYELARAKRYGHVFSMLLLDLDDFKGINDEYGHPAGDEVLRKVADTCTLESREVDVVARYGGDEFALLMPALEAEHAMKYASRLRELLAESKTVYKGKLLQTTVSVGVVTWTPEITELDRLIYLMDKALYDAKHAGKDTIRVSGLEGEYPIPVSEEISEGQ